MKPILYIAVYMTVLLCISCSEENKIVKIKNEMMGKLQSSVTLQEISVKKFALDSITAPRILYSQVYINENKKRSFTFLNTNNNSLYFYDFETLKLNKIIALSNTKSSKIEHAAAFHVKAPDSIYVYNKSSLELLLINSKGNILKIISLIGNHNLRKDPWFYKFPQYNPQAANPFLEIDGELLFTGQYMESLPDTLIDKFKFMAHLDLKTNRVVYSHTYPRSLYGFNYNWEGQVFTQVYTELNSDRDKIILSFPISHDLYISDLHSGEYKAVYGGSNEAGTISSIGVSRKETSNSISKSHFMRNDEYGAIKYDKYRKVYYRFLRKSVPNGDENTDIKKKMITVIILDENFNYVGEKTIGRSKNWFLENVFVTKEGLNIEYLEDSINEDYLTLKIFTIKKNL